MFWISEVTKRLGMLGLSYLTKSTRRLWSEKLRLGGGAFLAFGFIGEGFDTIDIVLVYGLRFIIYFRFFFGDMLLGYLIYPRSPT